MRPVLYRLKLLRDDMRKKEEVITATTFTYHKCTFDCLFTNYEEKTKKYQLLKIKFFNLSGTNGNRSSKSHPTLEVWANSSSIDCEIYNIFNFFNVITDPNPKHKPTKEQLYNIIQNFYNFLNQQVPTEINRNLSSTQTREIKSQFESMDDELKKVYCCGVKRNTPGKHRTNFNATKTRRLRPDVYEEYKDDPTLSFLFSEDKEKNKTTEQIRHNFALAGRSKGINQVS